jgi:hypothetical protein
LPDSETDSTSRAHRRLRFFGLVGSHFPHWLPTLGTPPEEPVPNNVNLIKFFMA